MRYEHVIRSNFKVTSISGSEVLCHCPWHADTSQGHLYVNAVKGLYLCMSCGAKGHLDKIGADLPQISTEDLRERMKALKAPPKQQTYYPEAWLKQYDVPHPYWTADRGLSDATVALYGLGYDPFTHRVTLPLRDRRGRILGVTYRRLDDGRPKYLHPKGFPIGRHLYGAWLLGDKRKVALVEGQVDSIRGWEAGIPAVSMMGSRLTKDQVRVLQQCDVHHVVLMLDNDAAGIAGTVSVHEALKGSGIRVSVGWYRDYWIGVKDPDGLTTDRYRKMFFSSVSMTEWADKVQ